ncbi:MAG: hypothetical protein HY691_14305 [Chloroflexi bacterium]|nr:hypothetical protein [Chloroflexota bacterium]
MTLIVGVKCTDGIVLAADSAATLGAIGDSTIVQNSASKLKVVDSCLIVGTSGSIGLGQRIAFEVERLWNQKAFSGTPPTTAMVILGGAFKPHLSMEAVATREFIPLIGAGAAARSALSHTLVAMTVSKRPCLFQFDHQGAPEEASEDLPFVSIGNGQRIADPFLAFIRRIFWPTDLPSVTEGVFAAVWTLDHCIETHPGGVNGPVHVAVIEARKPGEWIARHLAEPEVVEHRQAIDAAESSLRQFRASLAPSPASVVGNAPPTP